MKYIITLLLMIIGLPYAYSAEWSGNFSIQSRYFMHTPLSQNPLQHEQYLSLAAEPEWYHSWDNDAQSITITPFLRIDQHDDERSHGDIRELFWQRVYDSWELRAGIAKVYWGVTESQHLVDVINQTDFIENIDGEDKLGQVMINASTEMDMGTLDLFILPGFRERTFPGIEGRPRSFPYVDTDQAVYQSSDEQKHIDYALRWFQIVDDWEIGLSYFVGTSREPVFQIGTKNLQPVLIPVYLQMHQLGLDIQATTEEWLWKFELISRQWQSQHFYALTAGLEYTFVGIFESDVDLGLVSEYLYDDRDQQATSFFHNDVMLGLRLTLNDTQSTEALLGVIVDLDNQESFVSLEFSRRLGEAWKLDVEARTFQQIDINGLAQGLRKDDFIQLDLAYYF